MEMSSEHKMGLKKMIGFFKNNPTLLHKEDYIFLCDIEKVNIITYGTTIQEILNKIRQIYLQKNN